MRIGAPTSFFAALLARRSLQAPVGVALLLWRARFAVLALAVASCLPLALRLLHMSEEAMPLGFYDLGGIFSDIGIGLAVSLLLVLAWRSSLLLFCVTLVFWLALNAGYYEFLRQFGSPYFLIHAGNMFDGTFLEGSGTELSHPWLMAASAVVMIVGIGRFAAASRFVSWQALLGVAATVTVGVQFLPDAADFSVWRQKDFVSANAGDIFSRVLVPEFGSNAKASDTPEVATFLKPDLQGVPILKAAGRRNVIVIFVESLAGGHVPSLAAAHGNTSVLELEALDAIAGENLAFSTFVTHQKKSNQGLFASLCGAYPHLEAAVPDMTDIANGPGRRCLPAVLKANGYNTLFMKSANSGYMQMGMFMRKVGFDRTFGEEDFPPELPRAKWGLDDATLYGESLKEIDALSKQDKPYFLALFTSSTHHPFHIPASFTESPQLEPRARAWAFADHAVAGYLDALKARGVLDDTLVLVTSDEATVVTEPTYRKDDLLNGITENWGLMVALSPERARGRIDTPYQQADLPVSILDYLGLGDQSGPFIGRSLFRSYSTPRSIYFANIYKRRIYEYNEARDLTVCDEGLTGCTRYDATKGSLFSNDLAIAERNARPSPMLRAIRAHSMLSPLAAPSG